MKLIAMIIEKGIPIPPATPLVDIKISKGISIPNKDISEQDLILHNLAATAKYHANHLHDSGCYDEIDAFHDRMTYNYVIGTVRYARKIGIL